MYFFKKYKNRMIVTLVAIILIVTIGISNKRNNETALGGNFLGNIFAPISKFFYTLGDKASNSVGNIGGIFNSQDKTKELEIELARLKDENNKLQNIIGKSDFLKSEVELLKTTDLKLVSGQVISKEPGNWYNRFRIDKGSKDGIKVGDIIVQGVNLDGNVVKEGLIGRVIKVGDKYADVATIIDEQNSVSFKVIRTQDGGMIKGNIDSSIEGYLFDRKADVVVGDKLYTSGLGKGYIEDLYIGEVTDVVQLEEDLMKKIFVKPAIDFKKIYKVFAIVE